MKKLARLADSPELLAAFIESRRHTPFIWGSNDCCIFPADAIEVQTGVDPAKRWRGYKTAKGAAGHLKRAGGMTGLARAAGLTPKHPGFASRGEVVLILLEGRETLAIVSGNGMCCGPGESGLVFRPVSEAIAAFGF